MLYKIDNQSKINFINLVYSFIFLDGNITDEKEKLLKNLDKNLLDDENHTRILYRNEDDIKKIFSEIHTYYRDYLIDILLEINNKNNYKDKGIISKLTPSNSIKGKWDKWLKSELK